LSYISRKVTQETDNKRLTTLIGVFRAIRHKTIILFPVPVYQAHSKLLNWLIVSKKKCFQAQLINKTMSGTFENNFTTKQRDFLQNVPDSSCLSIMCLGTWFPVWQRYCLFEFFRSAFQILYQILLDYIIFWLIYWNLG
jgi:hypothetical protein